MLRRTRLYFLLIPALALLAFFLLTNHQPKLAGNSVVAVVNGEPITYGEMKREMDSQRARVIGTSSDGEEPLEKLKKEALSNAVNTKVMQMMAKEKGVVADISYEAFLKGLTEENKRRAAAVKSNQAVFGPEHYGESEYYRLIQSNIAGELKKILQSETVFSDEQLQQYYDTNKEQYKVPDTIRTRKVTVSGVDADAGKIMKDIRSRVDSGMNIDEASSGYGQSAHVEEQIFDAKSAHSDTLGYPILLSKVQPLLQGQLTGVFQENGKYLFAQCIERTTPGYLAFKEVKEAIRSHLAGQAYDREIERLLQDAKVSINEDVYDRIRDQTVQG
ncbi:peptidyl-prolyl cis-trans isomerase [Paenibacillus sepulcri]|uniref:Peptidyl-prolyl cis-trans isomerase n=1 Tax=Paenibacillus sepulcri TaxID=359917 RepID=A0ABS7BWE9_9BACL|nr:peptidyl-prolyl cis-trans isomerase [Paenibacillus sepulcri]